MWVVVVTAARHRVLGPSIINALTRPSYGALVALLTLAGCGTAWVTPTRSGFKAASRPGDCAVDFLRKAPERGYDELGEMYSYSSRVVEPQDLLRRKACELGADAVIVTEDILVTHGRGAEHKLVAGIAIKYRDTKTTPEPSG